MEKTILVVEDDRGLNQGVAMALKNPMYRFLSAYTLKEAIEYWKDNQIDMVILDINLPDGSGYGFLESVRKESQIPVIMLTANDMEIDEV